MTKIMFSTIMGITALALLAIFAGSVSAQQTGATLPAAQDVNVQSLVSGITPFASVVPVHFKGGGGWHGRAGSGFGLYLGYGGLGGYYYGGYPYGYGSGYSVTPSEPVCVWNGYQYRCYDSSGRILE
jgi:hypothetical protein